MGNRAGAEAGLVDESAGAGEERVARAAGTGWGDLGVGHKHMDNDTVRDVKAVGAIP
jgi:hypothetical protein